MSRLLGPSLPDANGRIFDGVICFGGVDWWYHNRGHFDIQMMLGLSEHVPVLFVNSIGMRTPRPREGRMFIRRLIRKLRSVRRGAVAINDRFTVMSAPVPPGPWAERFHHTVVRRVRRAADELGIMRPLVWVACPPAAPFVDALGPAGVVYQRTDRYECFADVDVERIRAFDAELKSRADLTVFCSHLLLANEAGACRGACFLDHGVDAARFGQAGDHPQDPPEIRHLPRPRIGFVGGIDGHTFDPALFNEVVRRVGEAHFILVGGCSLPSGWCDAPNVTFVDQQPFERVPDFMAACDVLIMPWRQSRWIEACHPVKLKEYLAVGRPVVSTPFPELEFYEGLVATAADADSFADAIRAALATNHDAEPGRALVRDRTWSTRVRHLMASLEERGLRPRQSVSMPLLRLVGDPTPDGDVPVEAASGVAPVEAPQLRLRRATPDGPEVVTNDVTSIVILAGGIRPSPLVAASGFSVLDLFLTADRSVLDHWRVRCEAAFPPERPIPVQVVHDAVHPPPWPSDAWSHPLTIRREPRAYRGVAGLLHDVCRDEPDDGSVLVLESGRYLDDTLAGIVEAHRGSGAALTFGINPDASPAGIMVIRRTALREVAPVGFCDLKEQWVPWLQDSGHHVEPFRFPGVGALPLRTREEFIAAARVAHGYAPATIRGRADDQRRGVLRVVCQGAMLAPGVELIDSIAMPGSIVGANALLTRTLLCPDSRVQAGTDIADAVVDSRTAPIGRAADGPQPEIRP